MNVVEVDEAIAWHAVLNRRQFQFRHQSPAGSGQRGDEIPGENKHGAITARGGGEP